MTVRISILMPIKNAGPFLVDCLESICDQDFKDWELIAINDHSTDNSKEILEAFAQKDPRISFQDNYGKGIIDALQQAYNSAKGELIHRMDADDLMTTDKLSTLFEALKKEGRGTIATAKVQYFAEEELSEGFQKYEEWLNEMVDQQDHWEHIYKECVIASPCWMIYREDLDRCEAFKPNRYPEDYDLVFRFYKYGLKVKAVDKVIHLWRDHAERSSRNHKHYQDNSFFTLKLHYFFDLDRDLNRPLLVWGAGPSGKRLAKMLKERKENFKWFSNNPKKHGKEIYGKLMRSFKEIIQIDHPQIIITVAQKKAKKEILNFLHENDLKEKEDFWFFR